MNQEARFEKEQMDHVGQMREQFFRTGSAEGIVGVRPVILKSWQEYYACLQRAGGEKPKEQVSAEELSAAKERQKNLINVAVYYMERLRSFLSSDDFWITLMDSSGIILKVVGSTRMVELARSTGLFEGAYRGPGSYPGLFRICQELNEPFQIVSTENPLTVDDVLAGSAAPIHEIGTGRFLGAVGISGYWWNSHNHTLGLAVLAAEAIAKQLALEEKNREIVSINQNMDLVLETVDYGLVYYREDGVIRTANRHAMDLLAGKHSTQRDYEGRTIYSYFNEEDGAEFLRAQRVLTTQEMPRGGVFSCDATPSQRMHPVHCIIHKAPGRGTGYLMQLQKRSDLSKIVSEMAFPKATFTFDDIIGASPAIESARKSAEIAAMYSPSILITGESGTGKELFAQAIHNASPRAKGPFIAVNCGAIPKSLIESELFGYEAGAFTGAQKTGHQGKFELADQGTIFLDEIGDMPYETQVSLLRVLQNKEVVRIGGKNPVKVDVMIIAATNQKLETRLADHSFREDVYYRLNVFNMRLPALRERADDVVILSEYFVRKYSEVFDKKITGISEDALDALRSYSWPGNVRELENAVERAIIISDGPRINRQDLPESVRSSRGGETEHKSIRPAVQVSREKQREEEMLHSALQACGGNLVQTAKQLGISRPTLYKRLKKYGLYPLKKV